MKRDFRERALAPAGASPTGSMAPTVLVAALFVGATFVVTAILLAGPPSVLRSLILCAYLLAGVVLCRGFFRLTDRAGWGRRPWLQAAGAAAASALTVGIALFVMQSVLNSEVRWETLPWILALAFGASLSGCALAVSLRSRLSPRTAPPAEARSAARFLARLPSRFKSADLWAVQAEDHYLRVHTSLGEALILMRLSDAVAELAGIEGEQVHRSWWVARSAVTEAVQQGRQAELMLKNGGRVPVSRMRAKELRARGWLPPRLPR